MVDDCWSSGTSGFFLLMTDETFENDSMKINIYLSRDTKWLCNTCWSGKMETAVLGGKHTGLNTLWKILN